MVGGWERRRRFKGFCVLNAEGRVGTGRGGVRRKKKHALGERERTKKVSKKISVSRGDRNPNGVEVVW